MSVTKSKKYFGEKPLEGPVPFGSRYKVKNKEIKGNRYENRSNNRYINYPSPEELAEYERICEGSSSQIIALLDKDQIHRQKAYIKNQEARVLSDRMKMFFGAFCLLGNTAAVVYLAMNGHQIPSTVTAVALILSVKLFYANKPSFKKQNSSNNRFKRNHKK